MPHAAAMQAPCLQELPSSSSAQQVCRKTQSKACGSKQSRQAPVATQPTHISDFAMQQLLQAGVSAQLLQQLQTATHTGLQTHPQTESQSARHVPQQRSPPIGRSRHHTKPKRQAKAKGVGMRSGGSAGTAQRAQALKARQEAILRRISSLEGDQAQSSQETAGRIVSGRGLVWERVKPTMQVSWTGLSLEAA